MIVKGIIESFADRDNVKVRIPFLNGLKSQVDSTATSDLANAVLCQLPGVNIQFHEGDIVWVEFENTRWESPVIVGFLDVASKAQSKISYTADELKVETKATLPENTSIGKVSAKSIACLENLDTNLNAYFGNTMPVYNLDLTAYQIGDTVPTSLLADIPENAMVILTMLSETGSTLYYPLIEKTRISQTDENLSNETLFPAEYNYVFGNVLKIIKIEGQIITS